MVDNWSIKFLVPVIFFPHLLKMGPAIDYCVCISFIRLCFFVLFCLFLGGGGISLMLFYQNTDVN